MEVKAAGSRTQMALCCPRGPSFEKWTKSGKKLRQNSKARSATNRMENFRTGELFCEAGLVFFINDKSYYITESPFGSRTTVANTHVW